MDYEMIVEDREESEACELTMEELEAVSGGCTSQCCANKPCNCGGS